MLHSICLICYFRSTTLSSTGVSSIDEPSAGQQPQVHDPGHSDYHQTQDVTIDQSHQSNTVQSLKQLGLDSSDTDLHQEYIPTEDEIEKLHKMGEKTSFFFVIYCYKPSLLTGL